MRRVVGARIAGSIETVVIVAPVVRQVVCRMGEVRAKEGGEAEEDAADGASAERGVTNLAAPPGEEEALPRAENRQREH